MSDEYFKSCRVFVLVLFAMRHSLETIRAPSPRPRPAARAAAADVSDPTSVSIFTTSERLFEPAVCVFSDRWRLRLDRYYFESMNKSLPRTYARLVGTCRTNVYPCLDRPCKQTFPIYWQGIKRSVGIARRPLWTRLWINKIGQSQINGETRFER